MLKIILLYGGNSFEHEVSILSAKSFVNEISYKKYEIQLIFINKNGIWFKGPLLKKKPIKNFNFFLDKQKKKNIINPINIKGKNIIVFPLLHGSNGEDGTIQGFLEVLNIPYIGSGILESSIGINKIITKYILKSLNIPYVPYICLEKKEFLFNKNNFKINNIKFPIIIKPFNLGSSIGIKEVNNIKELYFALKYSFKFTNIIIIEKKIFAREIEIALIGDKNNNIITNIGEIVKKKHNFYSYNLKYKDNKNIELKIPTYISKENNIKIKKYSLKIFKNLNFSGLCRFDFFLTKDNKIFLNELNTMPGFTKKSMFLLLYKNIGLNYNNVIEKLIFFAFKKFNNKKNNFLKK